MLVLERKAEPGRDTIWIGETIRIVVVSLDRERGCVKIGFDAPREIEIHREEHLEERPAGA